ncbi:PQQ-dependent sugar dehydrogenase [Aeoliella sp.]|uniref:PQQ-dependent sugar dehydrogenase n=1 Tax=Aeoliella sp. TaxID=2795800 RepID=UPI003CCBF6AA
MRPRRSIEIVTLLGVILWGIVRPSAGLDFGIERVATGLDHPVYVTQAPGDTDILYVVEQRLGNSTKGRISTFDLTTGVRESIIEIDNLDAKAGFDDGGLHTMTFHPDFQSNGKFYVSWVDSLGNSRVDEFTDQNGSVTMSPNPILSYPTLATRPGRHSIGWIGFKPGATGSAVNHLYITTGEGGFPEGSANYVNVSQDLGTNYGKVLRIEVGTGIDAYPDDATKNFGIPDDNPHVDSTEALGEVFHSGLRNPWRASFDRATGDMYIGDVGWLTREEIDFVKDGQAGLDFGWSNREGTIEVPGGSSPEMGGPIGNSVDPIFEYDHAIGVSIAGGYVYRGPVQSLQDSYFFADSFSGRIWMAEFDRDTPSTSFDGMNLTGVSEISADLQSQVNAGSVTNIVSFGEDNAGNVYLVKIGDGGPAGSVSQTGEIFRLTALPTIPETRELFVLVNPTTGEVQLRNQSGSNVAFEGYQLLSDSGSLLPDEWQSLDDLDGSGIDDGGWRESNPSPVQLAELLQSGGYTLADDQVIRLGNIFDTGGGIRDLAFQLLLQADSDPRTLRVIYDTLPDRPDFNGDGVVNLADYTVWRNTLGATGIGQAADGNGDGIVDETDYRIWKDHGGQTIALQSTTTASQVVPEASAFWMLILLAGIFWIRNRLESQYDVKLHQPAFSSDL